MLQPIRNRFIGGMKHDPDPKDLKGGDYSDAHNIRQITDKAGVLLNTEPILGNKYAFDSGSVSAQNKKIRLYPDFLGDAIEYTISVKVPSTILSIVLTTSFTPGETYSNFVASLVTAITTGGYGGITFSNSSTHIDGFGQYIELEISSGVNYYDYKFSSIGDNSLVIRTSQEAIDTGLQGDLEKIGSYDSLGDLFQFSSSQRKEIVSFDIVNSNLTETETSEPHGFISGQRVVVKNNSDPLNNDEWIILVISAVKFQLLGSTSFGGSGGTVTANENGYGVISVSNKNPNNDIWTHIKLLRSAQLNFRVSKQIDCRIERTTNDLFSIYFTDFYNSPRGMYYRGEFETDGFIELVSGRNHYDYGNITAQTILLQSAPAIKMNISQTNNGYLASGTNRYVVRLAGQELSFSEWSYVSNPIPIFTASTADNYIDNEKLVGDAPNTQTSKANIITVSNVNQIVYRFIELACIHYSDNGIVAFIVKRDSIVNDGTGIVTLTHTGRETNTQSLDLNSINTVFREIDKARHIEILGNRLELSCLEVSYDKDFSEIASNINYVLLRAQLKRTGVLDEAYEFSGGSVAYKLGEFQVPENVFNSTGYMINETYRFGIRFKRRNGGWTSVYFIDDITIDLDVTNPRKETVLSDLNLTDDRANEWAYQYFLTFKNIDFNTILSDGTKLRDNIEGIMFDRCECIPEIIASGVGIVNGYEAVVPEDLKTMSVFFPDARFSNSGTGSELVNTLLQSSYILLYQGCPETVMTTVPYTDLVYGNSAMAEFNGFFNTPFTEIPKTEVLSTDQFLGITRFSVTNDLTTFNTENHIRNVQFKVPIDNKYGKPENSKYISTGALFYDINSYTPITNFDVFGGDTYTQKVSYLGVQSLTPPDLQGLRGYTQCRLNTQLLSSLKSLLDVNKNGGYNIPNVSKITTSSIIISNKSGWTSDANPQVYIYDNAYSSALIVSTQLGFNSNIEQFKSLPVQVAWSNAKIINSTADTYRIFPISNYKNFEPKNGVITAMMEVNGVLCTWQPRKFLQHYFNSDAVFTTTDGSETTTGSGAVMSRKEQELSVYGSYHKWGVFTGLSKGGKKVAYWINTEFKKLMRFGYDGTVCLSDENKMMSFFLNNLKFANQYDTPALNYGIHGVTHDKYGDVIFTIRAVRGVISEWQSGAEYSNGNVVYADNDGNQNSFERLPVFYYSLHDTYSSDENNRPGSGVDWEEFWSKIDVKTGFNGELYYNFYTIVFNEIKNTFSCTFEFKPKIYLKYLNGFLSPSPINERLVYEHDFGSYLKWYSEDTEIHGQNGDTPNISQDLFVTYVKDQNTVSLTTDPVGYFTNEYFFNLNNVYTEIFIIDKYYQILSSSFSEDEVTITIDGTVPSDGTSAQLIYRKCQASDAYIQGNVNIQPDESKRFLASKFSTLSAPYKVDYDTEQHHTELLAEDFTERNEFFESPIKNDMLTSSRGITNNEDTSNIWGKYMKVKMFFKIGEYNKLFNFITSISTKFRTSK